MLKEEMTEKGQQLSTKRKKKITFLALKIPAQQMDCKENNFLCLLL